MNTAGWAKSSNLVTLVSSKRGKMNVCPFRPCHGRGMEKKKKIIIIQCNACIAYTYSCQTTGQSSDAAGAERGRLERRFPMRGNCYLAKYIDSSLENCLIYLAKVAVLLRASKHF